MFDTVLGTKKLHEDEKREKNCVRCKDGLSLWLSHKESTCQCRRHRFDPWVGKIRWRRKWQPTQIFLPGGSYGQRSLVGYSPWCPKKLDMTWGLSKNTSKE